MLETTEEEGMDTFDPMTPADHLSRVASSSVFTLVAVGFLYFFHIRDRKMMDPGENCCITNTLSYMVDVIDTSLFPIGVAFLGGDTVQYFCTKRGLLPMPLNYGPFYF